jgi:hypothetical protein
MKVLFFLFCILLPLVWLMKVLRRREHDRFLEANADDLALLEQYKTGVGIEPSADKPLENQEIHQKAKPNLAHKTRQKPTFEKAEGFTLKQIVLSEAHRKLLRIFDQLLGDRYRVFVHLPLEEFLEQQGEELGDGRISFLICDADYFNVVAGVEIENRDAANLAFLDKVFLQIDVPLVRLSKVQASHFDYVREKLDPFLNEKQKCPLCHSPIQKRKVSQAGKFQPQIQKKQVVYRWVCVDYPACKGNLRP